MDRAEALGPPAQAASLAPLARELADQAERDRRLPNRLANALRDSGLPRMLVPASLGGGEVAPRAMIEALEELAVADASAAWCAMVSATAGYVAAYLEPGAAQELFGSGAIAAGVYAPMGEARRDGGAYVVTGRWPFASYSAHAELLLGGVRTEDGVRLAVFAAADVEIHDTWEVSGLRGTGSNDMSVDGVRIPAVNTASLAAPPAASGPLYAFPVFGLLALGIAAVALGAARGAIDDLRALAGAKKPGGSRRLLAERATVQADVARAAASVAAARALISRRSTEPGRRRAPATGCRWRSARACASPPPMRRARCAEAVDLMYDAGGGTSIYAQQPAPAPLPRHPHRDPARDGRPGDAGAGRAASSSARRPTSHSCSRGLTPSRKCNGDPCPTRDSRNRV